MSWMTLIPRVGSKVFNLRYVGESPDSELDNSHEYGGV